MKSKFVVLVLLGLLIAILLAACADLQAMVAQGQPAGLPAGTQVPVGSVVTTTQTVTLGTPFTATPGAQITSTLPIAPGPAVTTTQTISPGITTTRAIPPGATLYPSKTMTTPQTVIPQQPPSTLDLDNLNSLDQFASYRSTTSVTFTTDTGQRTVFDILTEVATINSIVAQADADQGQQIAKHWVITLTQDGDQVGTVEFVTADGRSWVQANNEWAETEVLPGQLLSEVGWVGNPDDLISEGAQARFVREENLGEEDTWVYRLGFKDLQETEGLVDLENGEALLWISPQYMLPLRTYVRAVGNAVLFGPGTVESVSTLTAVNVPVQFPLPPDLVGTPIPIPGTPTVTPSAGQSSSATPIAPGTATASPTQPELLSINGLPLIQGATNIRAVDNVVVYDIGQSPQSVLAFYSNLPPDTGWALANTQPPVGGLIVTLAKNGTTAQVVAASGQTSGQAIVIIAID